MTSPNPNVDVAWLDQVIFVLHHGLGQQPDTEAISELLKTNTWLTSNQREHIVSELANITTSSRFHPGLRSLGEASKQPAGKANGDSDATIEREASSYLLHDTFILELTSSIHAQPLSLLSQAVQPLAGHDSILGQCFLLTIASEKNDHIDPLSICAEVFNQQTSLSIEREEMLLGRPIWQISDPAIDHSFYLWNKGAAKLDRVTVLHILNLFCCRAKILYAASQSAQSFATGMEIYSDIEHRLREISKLDTHSQDHLSSQNRISLLEDHLAVLPSQSHELSRCERDMEAHLLTLVDNVENARKSIALMQANKKSSPGDFSTFFTGFLEEDCAILRRQIEHDLKVLIPGRRYADQAISTIRTIVTLDSQKQQLRLELQEKLREQSLRRTIAIVGSGLTISGLAATTRPRPSAKILQRYLHQPVAPPPELMWLSDIGIHACLGLMAAALVASLWSLGTRRWKGPAAGADRADQGDGQPG